LLKRLMTAQFLPTAALSSRQRLRPKPIYNPKKPACQIGERAF